MSTSMPPKLQKMMEEFIDPLEGNDINVGIKHGFNHCWKIMRPVVMSMKDALENLDEWQGNQMCNASVYEIEEDEFAHMQCTVHEAMEKIQSLLGEE